jgi:hypothetical protein
MNAWRWLSRNDSIFRIFWNSNKCTLRGAVLTAPRFFFWRKQARALMALAMEGEFHESKSIRGRHFIPMQGQRIGYGKMHSGKGHTAVWKRV